MEPDALTEESAGGQKRASAFWFNTTKTGLTNTYIPTYFPGPGVKSWPNEENNNNSRHYREKRVSAHVLPKESQTSQLCGNTRHVPHTGHRKLKAVTEGTDDGSQSRIFTKLS